MDDLLFYCAHFGLGWHRIYQWLGISFVAPTSVGDHLHQFCHLAGFPRAIHSFLTIIWMTIVWVIWKERNNMIFNQKINTLDHLLDNVKFISFSWLKTYKPTYAFSYHDWWRHPLLCMGVLMYLCFVMSFFKSAFFMAPDYYCIFGGWFSFAHLLRDEPLWCYNIFHFGLFKKKVCCYRNNFIYGSLILF